jgi:hypothetical protein
MKILIVIDFLMLSIHYDKRLDFLKKILDVLDCEVVFANPETFAFSREVFLEFCNKHIKHDYMYPIYYNDITKRADEYIYQYLYKYDLIITYEASNTLRQYLDNVGITFIDLWVSPIRFYKDFMFSFYSNDKNIQKKLKNYMLKDKKLYKRATILKQQVSYLFDKSIKLKQNSALVIGQLLYDKSVLKGGKFLTLLDFKNS